MDSRRTHIKKNWKPWKNKWANTNQWKHWELILSWGVWHASKQKEGSESFLGHHSRGFLLWRPLGPLVKSSHNEWGWHWLWEETRRWVMTIGTKNLKAPMCRQSRGQILIGKAMLQSAVDHPLQNEGWLSENSHQRDNTGQKRWFLQSSCTRLSSSSNRQSSVIEANPAALFSSVTNTLISWSMHASDHINIWLCLGVVYYKLTLCPLPPPPLELGANGCREQASWKDCRSSELKLEFLSPWDGGLGCRMCWGSWVCRGGRGS